MVSESRNVNNASLDFQITDGSVITVLPLENVISIEGNVYNPGLITYTGRQSINKCIELAGGLKKNTIINDIYIKRANGKIKRISRFNKLYVSAKPGDAIIVPLNPNPTDFDTASFTADIFLLITILKSIFFITL